MVQINGKDVGRIGYGLMGFTWRPDPMPTEQAIEVMKTALEAGCNFWNGGEVYGTPEYNSLHLLKAYFTKYPEDVDRVVISIKAGFPLDGTREGVRRVATRCAKVLEGIKLIDVFECPRKDPKTDIEETAAAMAELVKEGIIGGFGLSEVGAETIRRAAKVTRVAAVEDELSLWTPDVLTNGVAAACAENNIPLVAYSPIGRGFLTGQIKTLDDVPQRLKDFGFPRFQPGNFEHNLKLVDEVEALAKTKGVKPGQVAISWVVALNEQAGNPPILPIPGTISKERVLENTTLVELTAEELKDLKAITDRCNAVGERYGTAFASLMWG
ncbi:NADP-dependent oxidoreductase domain-containing protein [Schizophyllum commune]